MEGAEAGGEGSSAPGRGRGAARALLVVAHTIREERGGEGRKGETERERERFSGASKVRVRASGRERDTHHTGCVALSRRRSEVYTKSSLEEKWEN